MLALDDAALAMLVRAAREVPHGERARWLQRVARELEARAQCRLADEYDAAQQRGDVATKSRGGANIKNGVPNDNTVATVTDIGLTPKQVHEARKVRNADDAVAALAPTPAATRQRRYRERCSNGRITLRVTIGESDVVNALACVGALRDHNAGRDDIARAVEALLIDWAMAWRERA